MSPSNRNDDVTKDAAKKEEEKPNPGLKKAWFAAKADVEHNGQSLVAGEKILLLEKIGKKYSSIFEATSAPEEK